MTKNFKRLIAVLMFLLISLTFVSCGGGSKNSSKSNKFPMSFTDVYGRVVQIDKKPERIISLAPSVTETIYGIKAEDRLVGRTDYCDYPNEVSKVPSVGSIMEPSVEKIVELKPDLVIASKPFKKEMADKLESLNIKVVVVAGEDSFDGVYKVINDVGTITGSLKEAETVVSDMKKKVDDINKKLEKAVGTPKVYYVVSFGEFGDYTCGKGTFIDDLLKMTKAVNIAGDVEGWAYSLEKIIEKDPDMIICSKYFDMKKGIMTTKGYKDLRAVSEGKLFEIDNNKVDRQGPRIVEGFEEIAKLIHPECFK